MDILRSCSWAISCLVRWVVFEVLPLPLSTVGHRGVGIACRFVGCAVSIAVLSVALQASAGSHGELLALLWAGAALTALFIGNVAREWTFAICTALATWTGHAFRRDGVTLGGRAFLELHYPRSTRIRCECADDEFSYEWTEPTGRCSRIDVRLRPSRGRNMQRQRPVVRLTTAPRLPARHGVDGE